MKAAIATIATITMIFVLFLWSTPTETREKKPVPSPEGAEEARYAVLETAAIKL
jgi:hypothetical protein